MAQQSPLDSLPCRSTLRVPAALAPHQALLGLPVCPVECVLKLDAIHRSYLQDGIQTSLSQSQARSSSSELPVEQDGGLVHGGGLDLACVTCPVVQDDCHLAELFAHAVQRSTR